MLRNTWAVTRYWLGLSPDAPNVGDYADKLCRDYAPTNSYDYAEIMLPMGGYASIMPKSRVEFELHDR